MTTQRAATTINVLIRRDEDLFVAHCLELDIVAASKTLRGVKRDMGSLIATQIDYAFSNDNLDNLYHPAPAEVWEAFYKCKDQQERRVKVRGAFTKNGKKSRRFSPPEIIEKTCCAV